MTPQELIDLPGYGQANKHLKAMGMWRVTIDDTERIDWIEEWSAKICPCHDGELFNIKPTGIEMCWDVLRPSIDKAATENTKSHYRAYLED